MDDDLDVGKGVDSRVSDEDFLITFAFLADMSRDLSLNIFFFTVSLFLFALLVCCCDRA